MIGYSPSDCLMSYPGYSLGWGFYPSAEVQSVYFTASANWEKFAKTLNLERRLIWWKNGFSLKTARSRRYPVQTITDAVYADDIALLASTPTQAECLLNKLAQAAGGIVFQWMQSKRSICVLIKKELSPY